MLGAAEMTLRRLRASDAAAIAAGIGRWEVVKWLTTPPWPYGLADAVWFLNNSASDGALAIEIQGECAGIIALDRDAHELGLELGYWLAPQFHGQGFMRRAVGLLLANHFATSDEPILSGYVLGNQPSRRVLEGAGFRPTTVVSRQSRPIGHAVDLQRMRLDKADFLARG